MIERAIKTSQGNNYVFQSSNPDVIAWFNNPDNQVDVILKQINEERMYDPVFANHQGMTVLDLGANCGLFSLYAADSCQKLFAVEPTPATFSILKEIVKDQSNITTLQFAVGASNDPVTFFINENSTTNSLLNRNGMPIEVPGTTIASLLDSQNIDQVDFIKCDIEGSEMQALTDETLGPIANRVKFWFVEVHQTNVNEMPWPGNLEQNRQSLAALFQRHGYQTEFVIHDQLFAWRG